MKIGIDTHLCKYFLDFGKPFFKFFIEEMCFHSDAKCHVYASGKILVEIPTFNNCFLQFFATNEFFKKIIKASADILLPLG